MEGLLGGSLEALAATMRFRLARGGVLASNVVNADTPGYRRSDVRFDERLRDAALRLERSHPGHLDASGAGGPVGPYRLERGPKGTRPDGNGVDLQHELVELSRNAGSFTDQATVLARLVALRRMAVTGNAG